MKGNGRKDTRQAGRKRRKKKKDKAMLGEEDMLEG